VRGDSGLLYSGDSNRDAHLLSTAHIARQAALLSLAGGAGLALDIRNRIQGHALQYVGSRHYDRHGYLEEKRAALEQWERYLRMKLAGDNIVPLKRQA